MRKFELTILGSNSAMPAHGRFPTSQVLAFNKESILIDCGEGSQIRMAQYKVKRHQISRVLISHLHGDHVYGLPGFIGSLAHLSRLKPLYVYGPKGIKEYLETVLRLSHSHLPFEIIITELESNSIETIAVEHTYSIQAFPVSHRIPTYGYLISETAAPLNIRKEAIAAYSLTVEEILMAKAGDDINRIDGLIPNKLVTLPKAKPRSYAYCADTKVEGWRKEHLRGVDTMYFETTYLHDLVAQAHERGHATALEAGQLAVELGVGRLVIGHYSSRYRDVQPLVEESSSLFSNTILGYDGLIMEL